MRSANFDIAKLKKDCNNYVALLPLPLDAGTESIVKNEFINGHPFHVKEFVLCSTYYPIFTLTD